MHRFHGCGYGFGAPSPGVIPTAVPPSLIPPPAAIPTAPSASVVTPGAPPGTAPAIPGMRSGVHHGMLCMPVAFCPLPGGPTK